MVLIKWHPLPHLLYSLKTIWDGLQIVTIGQYRRLHSPKPHHIGITGDPPLCLSCAIVFSTSQDLTAKNYLLSLSFNRLKASAGLGCIVCSILYNAEWTPLCRDRKDLPMSQKIRDLANPPDHFSWTIRRSEDTISLSDQREAGYFVLHVEATLALAKAGGERWEIDLLLVPEKDIESMMPRAVSVATTPASVSGIAAAWIENCQSNHLRCGKGSSTWKPTRLIYVETPTRGSHPKLCLSSGIPQNTRYTTLSHCWGSIEFFKLLSSNLQSLVESIPIEQLSGVFQDAIDLTRRIGIEYIWIDSLCIVQDSSEDWTRESEMMGKVYQHSWANISATGFKNGSTGLFIRRSPSLLHPVKFNLNIQDTSRKEPGALSKDRYYCLEDFWDAGITAAPLMQRAWVFQERVLAPRVLHIGECQMFWECRELEASEVFPVGIPKQFKKRFKSLFSAAEDLPEEHRDVAALEIWGEMVADYNRKALTRSSDKLVAISGIATIMQKLLKDELVAGRWKRHILQQLLWSVRDLPSDATRQRPTEYQAPSWSWASLNVAVEFLPIYDANPLVTIKDIVFKHGCEVETRPAIQGFISIRGRLTRPSFTGLEEKLGVRSWDGAEIELTMRSVSSETPLVLKVFPHPDLLEYDTHWKDHWKDGFPYFPPLTAFGSREFWLLPICESRHCFFGLILKHTEVKGQYKRLGIFLAEVKSEIQFAAILSHTPLLEPVEYEERYENGESLIRII